MPCLCASCQRRLTDRATCDENRPLVSGLQTIRERTQFLPTCSIQKIRKRTPCHYAPFSLFLYKRALCFLINPISVKDTPPIPLSACCQSFTTGGNTQMTRWML